MGHGVEAYVVFGETDNDKYVIRPRTIAHCRLRSLKFLRTFS